MTEEYFQREQEDRELDEKRLITNQMERANISRSIDIRRYCKDVEGIILNLPRGIRGKAYDKLLELGLQRGKYSVVTEDTAILYDELQNYIRDQLEKNNIMWPKKQIRTYE